MSSRKSQVKGSQSKGIPIRPSSTVLSSKKSKSVKGKRVQSSESESSSSSSSSSSESSSEESSSEEEVVVKKSKKSKQPKKAKVKEIPAIVKDPVHDAAHELRSSIDGIASSIGSLDTTNEILKEIAIALGNISEQLGKISERQQEDTKDKLDELDGVISSTNKMFLVGHPDVPDDFLQLGESSHVVRCASVKEIAQLALRDAPESSSVE
ncbi:hypothetical protein BGZ82_002123 [Podila clonocystis]|nr:hypothetical protein BGZ82_002123 [Podila clonocystis]